MQEKNFLYKIIPNNLCGLLHPKEEEHKFLIIKSRLHIVTSFQGVQCGEGGGKSKFAVEKPGKHYLSQVVKVN